MDSDIAELEKLGAARDVWKKPGIVPVDGSPGRSIDLEEYPIELLRLQKCRSFRADLLHKLTIIVRAHGGYGRAGMWRAALALGVERVTLWRWLKWLNTPDSTGTFERIDNLYSASLEKLVAAKLKRRRKKITE